MVIITQHRQSEVAKILRSDDPQEKEEARRAIASLTKQEEFCQEKIEDLGCCEEIARRLLDRHMELERRGGNEVTKEEA